MSDSPASIEVQPSGPFDCSVRPPGSKSITNRALVCAALADGRSVLTGALDSEDTVVMIHALRDLGLSVEVDQNAETITVIGKCGNFPVSEANIHVANSGTTIRFLTAMLTLSGGSYRLDGIARMRERPIGDLLDALNQLGASVESEQNACPPVIIHPRPLAGGTARISGSISSQYLSGLLMAAPYARHESLIQVEGELVSKPYVSMTIEVIRAFGGAIESDELRSFNIKGGQVYRAVDYDIEPDASAASYFWAAAAVTGGRVVVEGLGKNALQGDVEFCDCLARMGCEVNYGVNEIEVIGKPLTGISVDMNHISDTVQTLAAVALFAEGPTAITNVAHIRHKETDRIGDLAHEIRKFGAVVDEQQDGLTITPPANISPATIDTYNDHRMAMSLAIVGLRQTGVVINDPGCTVKTYPNFFRDLHQRITPR